MKHIDIYDEMLAHFLTDFSVTQPPRNLELYVVQHLTPTYSQGVVDDFIAQPRRNTR